MTRPFILFLTLNVILPVLCLAADKNGVSPNTISLPSGPGSIEGLGEAFQPTLNTGTGKYAIQLKLPPGTAGHAPQVSLSYEGGSGNGPLGFGWRLPTAYVQRQCDKGIPRYIDSANGQDDDWDGSVDEADEIDVFINEMKEELVPQANGDHFCENEGAFIRYRRVKDYWEGTLPDGTRMDFGLDDAGRILDPDTGRIFCWLVQRVTDTNGNVIVYRYGEFFDDANRNQKYLTEIRYGPGAPPWENFHFVSFVYENRPDWFEDCRSGFVVRTGKRLAALVVATQGADLSAFDHLRGDFNGDGRTDYLNRKYQLRYDAHEHWSLLTRVTPVGADGKSTLPASQFGYTVCNAPDVLSVSGQWMGAVNAPPQVMNNSLVELADLNGDGLPDILKTEAFGGAHRVSINQGEMGKGGDRAISWSSPQDVSSEDGLAWAIHLDSEDNNIAHLADMDGDGLSDLVYKAGFGDAGSVYTFKNRGVAVGWGPRRQMADQSEPPPSPYGRNDVRTADIDFDKRIDIIQSIDGGFNYQLWFNLGNQQYSKRVRVSQETGFDFALPGVFIADFNGDRVPDILRLGPQRLVVTAGLGHGHFAPAVNVSIPDWTLTDLQIQRAKLQDVSGDGLADVVIERASPGTLWYWVNLGNYTLTTRKQITGLPNVDGETAVRWADLNGNGTTDLVYAGATLDPRIITVDIGELI
ncbi:VCBS repeat-containing protein, partial [Candidatus Poribacteria bacterium]|nr:VCBS repeat-containing protein [Candidatus Poribacteria bacterium]